MTDESTTTRTGQPASSISPLQKSGSSQNSSNKPKFDCLLKCIQHFTAELEKSSQLGAQLSNSAKIIKDCPLLPKSSSCIVHFDNSSHTSGPSDNDLPNSRRLSAPLIISGRERGTIELLIPKEHTVSLSLMSDFLNTLAPILAKHIEHRETESNFIRQTAEAKQSLDDKIRMLKQHQDKILELSQPILSVGEGVFVVDENGLISSFNSTAEKITGLCRNSVIGKPYIDFFRAYGSHELCPMKQTILNGEETLNEHASVISAIGSRIPILLSTNALRDSQGEINGGVGLFLDLSGIERVR